MKVALRLKLEKKIEKRLSTLLRGFAKLTQIFASNPMGGEIRGLFEHLVDRMFDPLYGSERDIDFRQMTSLMTHVTIVFDTLTEDAEEPFRGMLRDEQHLMILNAWRNVVQTVKSCFSYLITQALKDSWTGNRSSRYAKVRAKLGLGSALSAS